MVYIIDLSNLWFLFSKCLMLIIKCLNFLPILVLKFAESNHQMFLIHLINIHSILLIVE